MLGFYELSSDSISFSYNVLHIGSCYRCISGKDDITMPRVVVGLTGYPGVAQAWLRRGSGVAQAWLRRGSGVAQAWLRHGSGVAQA